MSSPIDQALAILAATAWQATRKRHALTRRGRRILKRTRAMLERYRASRREA